MSFSSRLVRSHATTTCFMGPHNVDKQYVLRVCVQLYCILNHISLKRLAPSSGLQASEHIPPGYEAVSLLEALNGPLTTSSGAPPALHSGPSHAPGVLPPYSSEPHPAPARSHSPLDHSNSSQGLKLKKSGSK